MIRRVRAPNIRLRLYTVLALLALAATALTVRAIDLQVVRNQFYQDQGDARFLRDIPIPVSRGTILDRNGEPLAVSTPVDSIWADPRQLLQADERIDELAQALSADATQLRAQLQARATREFVWLRRHMDPDSAAEVLGLRIPGVASQREFRRFYPNGEAMAHVLGFTNIDDRGQEGLELAFDDWLAGKPGKKRVIRDRLGHVVENVELLHEAQPGRDLTLSIDRRIQYLAYRELKAAISEHGARSGSMVVLDVETGEVLAMVNQPSFNPNSRSNIEPSFRRNRALTDLIEPGSTMKPFIVAAALESGKWHPDTPIDTSPGTFALSGHVIRDVRNAGLIDVSRVITKSSNVGAAKIALTLTNEHMHDVLQRFGFGEVSGCGFPGESGGKLPSPRNWRELEKATLAYGYGMNATPLQLAQAYAALADGGRLRAPSFVRGARNPDRAVIDPHIADQVLAMMETVVSPEGSGLRAAVPNFRVAGKTGTSRQSVAGGYERRYISLFAGVAPASAPRLVGVVVVHDPQGMYYGGIVAAPVFSKVMDGALRLLDVPPDNVQQWYVQDVDAAVLGDAGVAAADLSAAPRGEEDQ